MACGTAKPVPKKPSSSLLEQLKADLAGPSSSDKTYAQAAAGATSIKVPVPAEDVTVDSDCEEQEDPVTDLVLPQEYTVLALQVQEPQELAEEWTAEVVASKFLPKKNAVDLARIEKELHDANLVLDLQVREVRKATERRWWMPRQIQQSRLQLANWKSA